MSFLHNIHIGFFGTNEEKNSRGGFELNECINLVNSFARVSLPEFNISVESTCRGNMEKGIVLAYFDGFPVILKGGLLICPYLSTSYIVGSIAFVLFVQSQTSCSIYSFDEGKFLSPEELIPSQSFSDIMRTILMKEQNQGTDTIPE
jgi:hypothetical protein